MIKNPVKEFIFDLETAPTPSCHASTVLPLPDGTVLASWFGGTAEGRDDVAIWVSRRDKNGWNKPIKVSEDDGIPHWNPVLDLKNDGSVCLYYKVGKKVRVWKTKTTKSFDGGLTWTAPKLLVENDENDGRGPVKNKCIRLSDGRLLAPASTEKHRRWKAFIDMSFDDGTTWEMQPYIVRPKLTTGIAGMIQPTLWEAPEGHVHALMRSNAGKIFRSDSKNYGKTWCRAYPISLPNNNSGIDCVKDKNGLVWLLYNHNNSNWGERTPLTLSVSKDNGDNWERVIDLESDEGEYSYPAITAMNQKLYITYTHKRERIAYWEISI